MKKRCQCLLNTMGQEPHGYNTIATGVMKVILVQQPNVNVNDDLMQHNDIYDTLYRRAAGFSNAPELLVFGKDAPKFHKTHEEYLQHIGPNSRTSEWSFATWIWVLMFHRNTGSGASFKQDHGFRNSLTMEFAGYETIKGMANHMRHVKETLGKPIFTSIGNQPPAPKKFVSNIDFLQYEAPRLCEGLAFELKASSTKWSHKQVVDYLNEYNRLNGHRRFNFQYAALAMDISDYFPEYVDEDSHTYLGNNAKRCAKLLTKGYKEDDAMELISEALGGINKFKDLEDYMCDFCRFMEDYDPFQRGIYFNNSGFKQPDVFKDRSGADRW